MTLKECLDQDSENDILTVEEVEKILTYLIFMINQKRNEN